MNSSKLSASRSPWFWIPTLYFAEGIPYFIVNNISVIMFSKMGVPNDIMSLYTSLLYLPWVIKPFWSPFVDIIKTKRWWILLMQLIMSLSFIAITLSIPHPSPEMIEAKSAPISLFTFTLILFYITAFASATHDIAADGFYMLALSPEKQTFFVGIRSTFYRLSSWFGQGVLVMIAGLLEEKTGDIPMAWTITMVVTAVIFAAITLYHTFFLPVPAEDTERFKGEKRTGKQIVHEFVDAFITFFKKPQALIAIIFMFLFRLPEALMLKLVGPFFLDPVSAGGLGMSTKVYGLVNGTIGVVALTAGGIIGGIMASRVGLKKSLWPMTLALTLPSSVYIYMSIVQPTNIWAISTCVAFEQFGYGFGFQAYMLYMMYFSMGEFKTSHYAICTGFMALSMMIPGLFAGYLWKWLGGYTPFFIFAMACCLITFAVTFLIKIDPSYGRKSSSDAS